VKPDRLQKHKAADRQKAAQQTDFLPLCADIEGANKA
jgi:hypothetical protein